jgi:membrane associated rhomboid family serine protease
MENNIKEVGKTIGITSAICLGATILLVALGGGNLILMNPLIKGYLHLSFEHFFTNMLMLFLALLSPINSSYDFRKIYLITLIISLIYLPAEILGLSQTALGLSGTCYFLLSRYFFSWKVRSRLGVFIICILALLELGASANTSIDKTAHLVHVIGIALGYLSLKYAHKKGLEKLGL